MVRIELPNGKTCEVSAHEITVGDYAAYVSSRASFYANGNNGLVAELRKPLLQHFTDHGEAVPDVSLIENEIPSAHQRLPITNIGALQAVAYCAWVSEQTGVASDQMCFKVAGKKQDEATLFTIEKHIATGEISAPILDVNRNQNGYRLPFFNEWQALVTTIPSNPALMDDEGWFDGNSEGRLHAVGQKRPNELGLFDLSGNVSEWFMRSEVVFPNEPRPKRSIAAGAVGGRFDAELGVQIAPFEDLMATFIGEKVVGYRLFRMVE